MNKTDTSSGRMLVLARQKTAIRTLKTVRETPPLWTVCMLRLMGAGEVAGTQESPGYSHSP